MRPVADRTEAVEGWNAERGGEIPVRAAARAALAEIVAELARDLPRLIVKTRHRRRAFQRRPIEAARDPQRRGRIAWPLALDDRGDHRRLVGGRGADVDGGPRLVGHDVRTGAAADDPDVDRDAGREPREAIQAANLMRELVDGARAFRRIDAGVRGNAVHRQLELAASFARRLDRAARQRRLEHEDRVAPPRFLFDRRTRGLAADLLVCRPQHDDPAFERGVGLQERPNGEHANRDARLHVEDARPVQPAVRFDDRHLRDLTDRPDRIEMSEQQDLFLPRVVPVGDGVTTSGSEFGEQMIAAIGPREPRDAAADRLEPRAQLAAAAIDRRLVGRGRFEGRERLDRREQPCALAAAVFLEVV